MEAQSEELISWGASDVDEKVGDPTRSDEKSYAFPFYLWFLAHIYYSVGALLSEEVADVDNTEMKGKDSKDENGKDDHGADNGTGNLSVMYPPCQDPMLVKIYQGLPALP
jgi:hypothetical protein